MTLTDDMARKQVGEAAVRFETNGGFDTYARYPGDMLARWDLTRRTAIRVWFYAINDNGFQERSPWIRLKSAGGYYQYQTDYDILNEARGQWTEFVIPLGGDVLWHRTEVGTADMAAVNSIEIHADTWDFGFTYWMDGLRFDRDPAGVEGSVAAPVRLSLDPVRPNPSTGGATVSFDLPRASRVQLAVYDVGGRLVRTLLDKSMHAGRQAARWDAGTTPSGVYILRLRADGQSIERKVVIEK